jgi:hypothetical protein
VKLLFGSIAAAMFYALYMSEICRYQRSGSSFTLVPALVVLALAIAASWAAIAQ